MSFASLPEELLLAIFSLVTPDDIVHLLPCSRFFHRFIHANFYRLPKLRISRQIKIEFNESKSSIEIPGQNPPILFCFCGEKPECQKSGSKRRAEDPANPEFKTILTVSPLRLEVFGIKFGEWKRRTPRSRIQRPEFTGRIECRVYYEGGSELAAVGVLLQYLHNRAIIGECRINVKSSADIAEIFKQINSFTSILFMHPMTENELLQLLEMVNLKELQMQYWNQPLTLPFFQSKVVQQLEGLKIWSAYNYSGIYFDLGMKCREVFAHCFLVSKETIKRFVQEWSQGTRDVRKLEIGVDDKEAIKYSLMSEEGKRYMFQQLEYVTEGIYSWIVDYNADIKRKDGQTAHLAYCGNRFIFETT